MNIAGLPTRPVQLDNPEVFHLPSWNQCSEAERLAAMRQIALSGGRDPRIATLAVGIIRQAGIQPRDYAGQAAVLLKWAQDRIYYINEPGERLQSAEATLRLGYGDCDDLAILLAALYESIRLSWRFILSGRTPDGQSFRFTEGATDNPPGRSPRNPNGVKWAHIYVEVGTPPFNPKVWKYAEPTMKNVPLGWDVVGARSNALPEMSTGAWAGTNDPVLDLARGSQLSVSREQATISSELKEISKELRSQLTARKLIVSVIFGAIVSGLVQVVVPVVKRAVFGKAPVRKNPRKRTRVGKRR